MEKQVWKLTITYDGTDFHGWQIQPDCANTPTVQGVLASAIRAVTGEAVLPQGSGRTDAGVHALGQVASFALAAPIPPENLARSLNRVLPAAIQVLNAEHAPAGFHARHSTCSKVYRYTIFQGERCSPFLARYVTECRWKLDTTAMQQAADLVLGDHDFTSFAATDPDRSTRIASPEDRILPGEELKDNVRRIEESGWSTERIAPTGPGALECASTLTYTVRGDGFLHHMVRNLVGTFLDVGRGRIPPDAIRGILHARDRRSAGPTAPAKGLCLVRVSY